MRYSLKSTGNLYASVDVAGIPRERPAVDASKLSVSRSFYNMDGSLWKGTTLREGQSLIVALKVESGRSMPDALLVDLLPAGLEIENLNLTPPEQWSDIKVDGMLLDRAGQRGEPGARGISRRPLRGRAEARWRRGASCSTWCVP